MRTIILILTMITLPIFASSFNKSDNIKNYYINLGLGGASNGYGSDYADSLKENSFDTYSVFVDLGVYFPIDSHLLVGGAITSSSDYFEGVFGMEYEDINYTSSLFGLSLIYFQNYLEEGLFFRGDIGITSLTASYTKDGIEQDKTSDELGMGFLAGIGYAFPFNFGTITTSLLYSDKSIKHSTHESSVNISTISFSVGGLF